MFFDYLKIVIILLGNCLSLYVDGNSLSISGNNSYIKVFDKGFVLFIKINCSVCSNKLSVIEAFTTTSNSLFCRFCKALDLCCPSTICP